MYLVCKDKYKDQMVVFELDFVGLGKLVKLVSLIKIGLQDWRKST